MAGLGLAAALRAEGRFTSPGRGETLETGESVEVRWSAPCPDAAGASESELMLSLDGGLTFPIRITAEMTACAKGFRWQIPALATAHARLALRAGTGEGSETERLDLVSDEFSIIADEEDGTEDLVRGPREWWTRQALDGDGAEDLPLESMAGGAESIGSPDSSVDATDPVPLGVGLARPGTTALPVAAGRPRPLRIAAAAARFSPPTPLRL